ncbi:right-handed parallel beta-helix repeat-containing protein [Chitinophaga sp. Cy-1792]|uniref:right-handed parallel beta-helix repeat-containing protein n=1 Tax=Chitinophaga sp. Cy-1792 TaxID=2608339 RepID=UPI001420487A|nr:right-handed parallel beta-helix repeat-containing protein [Chitinophaga sp. Cy-1792]NIG55471.1 T9SS type B sorting domain-containing protein [Chitinophaga sp. Cy-1792]
MKKFTITLLTSLFLLIASRLSAQTDIRIGNDISGNTYSGYPCPLQDYYEGSKAQYLILASELRAAGMVAGDISGMKINVINKNGVGVIEGYSIKLGTTTVSTLSATTWLPVSFTGRPAADYSPVLGWNTFQFTMPFQWNGTDNLVVDICNGQNPMPDGTWYTENPEVPYTTGLSFNASHTYRVDNTDDVCSTTATSNSGDQTTRPNLTFIWTPATDCAGTPTGGTANASASFVCGGKSFDLSITGSTVARGIKYQWQRSADNNTWADIPNDTLGLATEKQTATSYYRCRITCTNSGMVSYSTAVLVTSPVLVHGTNFTINKNLPTGGTNFASFNDAYQYMKCGIDGPCVFDVVAGSGNYNEQLVFNAIPGASAANYIVFNGHGDTLTYNCTSANRAILKLDNAAHFTFSGLVFKPQQGTGTTYGWGVHILNNADTNTIRNCTFILDTASTASNYAGIVISTSTTSPTTTGDNSCDSLSIIGNTIFGGYYGITVMGSSNVPNSNVQIKNNKITDFYYYGIYFGGASLLTVAENTLSRPVRRTVTTFYGIYGSGLNTRCKITRNTITNPFGAVPTNTSSFYGIYLSNVDTYTTLENEVSNNLIYNLTGVGTTYGIYNSGSDNNWFYHNTLSIDGASTSTTTYGHYGYYQSGQTDGVEFKNNMVSVTRSGGGAKYGIYISTATSTIISNYNNYYNPGTSGTNFVGYWGAAKATLNDWQGASSQDAKSYTTNPLFTSPATGNFIPANASIDNKGTPLPSVTIDILNQPRSTTTPDIGAFEFTPPPCTSPPTPGTTAVDKSPVCAGTKIALSLTGNSTGLSQTYQWQSGTAAAGPFTNIGQPLTNPDTIFAVNASAYYRVAVTCSGNTAYSTPVSVVVNPALAAGTYTINKTQPNSATNFATFNDAKAAMNCGIGGPVVFNVVPGTGPYNEQLILDSIPGTSAINTITFNGNGNTIAYTGQITDERATIKLRAADHVTFDSLVIDARGTNYGYGVHMLKDADSNTISRCVIITDTVSTSSNYCGIVVNGIDGGTTTSTSNRCDGVVLKGNTIRGGYYGILIYAEGTNYSKNDSIVNNTVRDFYSDGIKTYYLQNGIIDRNNIYKTGRPNEASTVYGISLDYSSGASVVSNNRVHNLHDGVSGSTNGAYAIRVYYSTGDANAPVKVFNNAVYNIYGGTAYGIYDYYANYVDYLHNTIVLDDNNVPTTSAYYGFYHSGTVSGINLVNNIFKVSRVGTGVRYGLYYSTAAMVKSDYNAVFAKNSGTTAYWGYSGNNIATLAAWKTATKLDSNSISIEPVFQDVTTGSLQPVISPLDNTGKPVGIAKDILNITRSTTTPDIGAFEISVPDCVHPVVPGTAVLTPNTPICMGNYVRLDLNGNSTGGHQTYQWQRAVSATGVWETFTDPQFTPVASTPVTTKKYFRCMVICGGTDTAYSTVVMATLNDPLLKGTYTINPALPTSTTNFQTFTAVASKLECGIAGAVVFEAASGTYNEQVTMHYVPGASDTSRVTFTSATGNAADVILTYAGTSALNYVLDMDSTSYVTWKNITVKPTGTTYARAIMLDRGAGYDSIRNMVITLPVTTTTSNNSSGIYANAVYGKQNVIINNTISNGSYGIYWNSSSSPRTPSLNIDSNTITASRDYGIYAYYSANTSISGNKVTMNASQGATQYGIYTSYNDTSLTVARNKITITNAATRAYGLYLYYPNIYGPKANISANQINMRGNTNDVYGAYFYEGDGCNIVNNVINVQTSGTNSYGLYSSYSSTTNMFNNTVLNSSKSTTGSNYAAYYTTSSSDGGLKLRNNIFAHDSSGRALYLSNATYINADYNTLYTNGAALVRQGTTDYTSLAAYRTATNLETSGIVYKPAFVSNTDLRPDVNNPEVWAIHGRGVQAIDNGVDINGAHRPTILTEGVPDMGAYEFYPAVIPPVLPATPATPAAGTTQTWMFGTDTVAKITWRPGVAVPTDMTVRRYSGVKPPNVPKDSTYMYFYTDVDANPSSDKWEFEYKQFYVDSWQGFIKREKNIRLAMTDTAKVWSTDTLSTVDIVTNVIRDSSLHYLDLFTGLEANTTPVKQIISAPDSSNRGTQFWVAYGHHQFFGTNNLQEMVLYLNAQDSANVTVRINGTSWEKIYHIPANTTITSDLIPKLGLNDARLLDEGLSDRGISIESDVPIEAYAHIYGSASSGATMLLPVGTYGYDYATLQSYQEYDNNCYSWLYVMANYDNTTVEITPTVPTLGGRTPGVPFTITLQRGEVYQVLGAIQSGSVGYDLSGSHVRSVKNSADECWPIAVFSGSSRTTLGCSSSAGYSGDNAIQQNFPSQAWGRKYLTSPFSKAAAANTQLMSIYRVLVKDPNTIVKVNGVRQTNLSPNKYYEWESTTAEVIEADQPVMVAQYMLSSSVCGSNSSLDGDPEMIYLSPVEQGVKKIGVYRNTQESITVNYLNVIVPTNGLTSLLIDNSNVFDYTYPHPNAPGYSVVVKRWGAVAGPTKVTCDSAFTAIIYGEGSVESYGYNAGTLVKNLNILNSYTNVNNPTASSNSYTCAKTPFRFSMLIQVKPDEINWKLSQVPNLKPHADVIQTNPVPKDSINVDGKIYYRYVLDSEYVFSAPGLYYVPIRITHPVFESCSNTFESMLQVKVIPAPVVTITPNYNNCLEDIATFNGDAHTSNGVGIASWKWDFGDSTYAYSKDTTKLYKTPGTKQVKLSIVAAEGCIGDTTVPVDVFAPVTVVLVKDSIMTCQGTDVTFEVKDPQPNAQYNWYDAATGGNLVHSGTTFTITNIPHDTTLYVEGASQGCTGGARAKAVAVVTPQLTKPVLKLDSIGVHYMHFKWNAVPFATGYLVSTDGGITWVNPSSGPEGTTHELNGLEPASDHSLLVKALGCADQVSDPAAGKTLPDGIFIPNTFTPNNDGKNDVLLVYGYIIRDVHMSIFNQWGEKVFESVGQQKGWDGTYKGKPLPSGAYIYVCRITLTDGTVTEKKGVINLVR